MSGTIREASYYMSAVIEMMQAEAVRHPYKKTIETGGWKERCAALKKFYQLADAEIQKAGRSEWGIDPYEVDWIKVFTPIEYSLWYDIRAADLVLYPQYPVLGFFVDFASPVARVAIECDGESFHKDKDKDMKRDSILANNGWRVYRISGRDCKSTDDTGGNQGKIFVERINRNYRLSRHSQW